MNDNKIDIHISEGKLESFNVTMNEDGLPDLTATIALYTAHGKKITTFSVGTESWRGDTDMKLPIATIPAIQKIAEEIEQATILSCRESQLMIGE